MTKSSRLSEEATMRKCSAAFYFTLAEVSTESCNCKNLNLFKNKCNNTEGIYDLTCFIKYRDTMLVPTCEWKHGGDISTSYTLCIQQRKIKCQTEHLINQKNTTWTFSNFYVANSNMIAHVIGTSGDHWCTYKNFSGTPSLMTLCGPLSNVTFQRSSGHLDVQVEWGEERKYIDQFYVMYREFNTTKWKKQLSTNNRECVLWDVTSSLPYELQIQCAPTQGCAQCSLSEVIWVPQELTDAPSVQGEIQDHKQNRCISVGQRKVVVMWKYANSDAVANYNVTVRKVSGECSNQDSFKTEDLSLTLILSYSAYNISVKALNSAGSSPVSSIAVEQMEERDLLEPFSVNITSNNSFSLSWNSSISSVCYSVEWWTKGQIPAFRSFYVKQTHKEITEITERIFQPYTRYFFFLHTRPDQDTCNMKNVNNSETTYGTAQAYLTEGSPVSAPGNVSILNITQNSAVITWSSVSEEDLRGFLLGYKIYCTKDSKETTFKVDPSINSYKLLNLETNSAYSVQLSAFTAAGEGKRRYSQHFVTNPPELTTLSSIIAAVIVGIIVILLAVHLSCRLLHRAKKLLWPSIPNPENSNAVQKIEIACEMEILEPLNRQRLEESEGCDSSTVCVVERKNEVSPLSSLSASQAGVKPIILLLSEDEDGTSVLDEIEPPDTPTRVPTRDSVSTETFPVDFSKTDCNLNTVVENKITSLERKDSDVTICKITGSDFIPAVSVKPAEVFMSDYTTLEIFQQVTMNGMHGPAIQTVKPKFVAVHPGQDYVRQVGFPRNDQASIPPEECKGTEVLNTEETLSSTVIFGKPAETKPLEQWGVKRI